MASQGGNGNDANRGKGNAPSGNDKNDGWCGGKGGKVGECTSRSKTHENLKSSHLTAHFDAERLVDAENLHENLGPLMGNKTDRLGITSTEQPQTRIRDPSPSMRESSVSRALSRQRTRQQQTKSSSSPTRYHRPLLLNHRFPRHTLMFVMTY